MLLAILLITLLATIWVGSGMIGAVLCWRGWQGRIVNFHPHCRACGHDLYGPSAPVERCPECGASLDHPEHIRIGRRAPHARKVAMGVALLTLNLLPVFALMYAQISKGQVVPNAVNAGVSQMSAPVRGNRTAAAIGFLQRTAPVSVFLNAHDDRPPSAIESGSQASLPSALISLREIESSGSMALADLPAALSLNEYDPLRAVTAGSWRSVETPTSAPLRLPTYRMPQYPQGPAALNLSEYAVFPDLTTGALAFPDAFRTPSINAALGVRMPTTRIEAGRIAPG